MTAPTARSHRRRAAGRGAPRLLRLLGALTTLALVVAGPPAVLLRLVGSPLDPPAALRSTDALATSVDDQALVWLLAALGWLLWTHLVGTVVVEGLRQTRGSTLRMPLPGLLFGANTALASHLIATLLLTAHASSPATLLTPASAHPTITSTSQLPPPPAAALPDDLASAAGPLCV